MQGATPWGNLEILHNNTFQRMEGIYHDRSVWVLYMQKCLNPLPKGDISLMSTNVRGSGDNVERESTQPGSRQTDPSPPCCSSP